MKHLVIAIVATFVLTGCYLNSTNNAATTQKNMSRVNEHELGKISYAKRDYSRAVQYQTQWLIKYPDDAHAYVERGLVYSKLDKSESAISDFAKAAELLPNALKPRIYECAELSKVGRGSESRSKLEEIMADANFSRISPYEKFLAYSLDGQFKIKAGTHGEALPSLNNAIRTFNSNAHVFVAKNSPFINRLVVYNRAVVYNKMGDYAQAANDMESFVRISQKANLRLGSKDYARLAIAYYLAEEYDKCRTILKYVSPQDREMLYNTLEDDMFLESK
ncbi:tetratricopeptide repeat protein [Candidatus Uabimicrobium sp. HlEnr_7]|uniref:tetratricopeptide repeat protein n=1 Tax=Candidatus Uabimicrobium helgolandensis TaxID=3095367 RepID=UPI003557EC0D